MIHESTIAKAWEQRLEDGDKLVCFTLDDVPERAFWGSSDWLPILNEAVELRTRARVFYSEPELTKCGDPLCGDGCCDDPNCTNVPAEERRTPFLVRADLIEWV